MEWTPRDGDRSVSDLTEQEFCSGIRQACARGKGVLIFQSQEQTWARELSPDLEWTPRDGDRSVSGLTEQGFCSGIRQACARGKGVLIFQSQEQTWARELNAADI